MFFKASKCIFSYKYIFLRSPYTEKNCSSLKPFTSPPFRCLYQHLKLYALIYIHIYVHMYVGVYVNIFMYACSPLIRQGSSYKYTCVKCFRLASTVRPNEIKSNKLNSRKNQHEVFIIVLVLVVYIKFQNKIRTWNVYTNQQQQPICSQTFALINSFVHLLLLATS